MEAQSVMQLQLHAFFYLFAKCECVQLQATRKELRVKMDGPQRQLQHGDDRSPLLAIRPTYSHHNPEGKRPLGRPRRRWEDNIRMDLQEVGLGYEDWIGLAQDRDRWRALVSTVRNLWVP